jgi:cysteine desulfurase
LAREHVARLIGAEPKEIVFTSGATESNNLAIKGAGRFYRSLRPHVVTVATEHKCVLESVRRLGSEGCDVTVLPVPPDGVIDLSRLAAAVTERTALVSVMAVNNEIGVIQPLAEIGAICRQKGALFHTDAAQAVGKIPLDVNELSIDLLSLSGHKLYGPKGIGALYVRRRPRVRLEPLIDGGGQEKGLRSGTLATPLCVGLGEACRIAGFEREAEAARLLRLRDRLLEGVMARLPGVSLNGDRHHRIAGNLNLSFAYLEGDGLLRQIRDIAVSTGSACLSGATEPSYVLRALGVDSELAHASVRLGLGRFTTEEEVDMAIDVLVEGVTRHRQESPLWELYLEQVILPGRDGADR